MSKCSLAPRFVAIVFGCFFAATLPMPAQAPLRPINPGGPAGGLRVIEEGQPPVMIHPTVEASAQAREAEALEAKPQPKASTANDLYYHGGVGGIGVETAPKVYLIL